jgi:3-hydroxybutyryl-CoA dehydrogenase
MTHLDASSLIGVVGAGAMGAGIAQVAAQHGHRVVLADALPASLERAREGHARAMSREVEKGRLAAEQASGVLERIEYAHVTDESSLHEFVDCAMVIEAVVEQLEVKGAIFRRLETVVAPDAVLASNTSSLSIAAIGGACAYPERVVGVHFFNPAPVMKLVEIIPAITTSPAVTATSLALVRHWGKTTVVSADTPGFIVNRIARPFYSESLRLLEEGIADCATIDWAIREFGGFRMGPFELMDFIGNDVNFAVTSSVFEAMSFDARYRPAITQRRLVEAGWLGRKTGRGYYDYHHGATMPEPVREEGLGRSIVDRVLAMLVNAAADALHARVASAEDVELAMTTGVNYPKGLLAWGDEIGAQVVLDRIDALYDEYREERYRASPLLRRTANGQGKFLA